MKITLTLEFHDDEIAESCVRDAKRFEQRLQRAIDREWPFARMGAIEVRDVRHVRAREDSSTIAPCIVCGGIDQGHTCCP